MDPNTRVVGGGAGKGRGPWHTPGCKRAGALILGPWWWCARAPASASPSCAACDVGMQGAESRPMCTVPRSPRSHVSRPHAPTLPRCAPPGGLLVLAADGEHARLVPHRAHRQRAHPLRGGAPQEREYAVAEQDVVPSDTLSVATAIAGCTVAISAVPMLLSAPAHGHTAHPPSAAFPPRTGDPAGVRRVRRAAPRQPPHARAGHVPLHQRVHSQGEGARVLASCTHHGLIYHGLRFILKIIGLGTSLKM